MFKFIFSFLMTVICAFSFFYPSFVFAAENNFINEIQQRGYLKVGLPPYNTPPAYYLEPGADDLQGYDIDLAKGLASKLGVDIIFDRSSTSFNQLVKRVGADDFDIAIGKLGLTYKRLLDAFPIQYLSFRHALLANRNFVASLDIDPDDPEFGNQLKFAKMRIGSLEDSMYVSETKEHFPNSEFVGFEDWSDAKNALINTESDAPCIDALYRDATEIKAVVYNQPDLSLKFVPILFDDIIDRSSIYFSQKGKIGLYDFVDHYLKDKWGGVKSDEDIISEFLSFYLPSES